MADYYMCSEGEVMSAALPSNFKLSSETILVFNEEYGEDFSALDHDEYLVARSLLLKKRTKIIGGSTNPGGLSCLPGHQATDRKKSMLGHGNRLKEKYKPKFETYVVLDEVYRAGRKVGGTSQ